MSYSPERSVSILKFSSFSSNELISFSTSGIREASFSSSAISMSVLASSSPCSSSLYFSNELLSVFNSFMACCDFSVLSQKPGASISASSSSILFFLFSKSNDFFICSIGFSNPEILYLNWSNSTTITPFSDYACLPQQFLYFFPLPHGQGSFGYIFFSTRFTGPFTDGPSSLLVPVTLATCSRSTFCST